MMWQKWPLSPVYPIVYVDAFLLSPTLIERRENAMLATPTAMGITKFDLRSLSEPQLTFSRRPVKVESLRGGCLGG